MTRTADDWEKLLEGATPGPWEPFHDTWEDSGPDGEIIAEYEQSGVIGGADGILDTNPRKTLMDAPNQWEDSGEHDNRANTHLAAAAPEAVAEVVRLRRELEELKRKTGSLILSAELLAGDHPYLSGALNGAANEFREIHDTITRILEEEA